MKRYCIRSEKHRNSRVFDILITEEGEVFIEKKNPKSLPIIISLKEVMKQVKLTDSEVKKVYDRFCRT